MVAFRTKLARLSGALGASPSSTHSRRDSPPSTEDRSSSEDPSGNKLEHLRDKIASILARAPAARPPLPDPTRGDLPFVSEHTALGQLHRRTQRLSPAHRVGRVGVQTGCSASAPLLALLALDPALSACDLSRALYIDTETTGLSAAAGTVPFLVGMAWYDGPSLIVEQVLVRRLGEEAPMLERVRERMAQCSLLVSYNGKSFDLPLLKTRFVMNRLEPAEPKPHLDLVHVARRLHKRRLGACNLTTVEAKVLGFERIDDIPSGDVCARYAHFLRTGDESPLFAVVDHNHWDVVAMAALVGLYGEPLEGLIPEDLAQAARTMRRARSLDLAEHYAEEAVQRGGGPDAVRARGEIAKARGDKARALRDFQSLVDQIDEPRLRLELAKLYEHHARAPLEALKLLPLGTGESEAETRKRETRLKKKSKIGTSC